MARPSVRRGAIDELGATGKTTGGRVVRSADRKDRAARVRGRRPIAGRNDACAAVWRVSSDRPGNPCATRDEGLIASRRGSGSFVQRRRRGLGRGAGAIVPRNRQRRADPAELRVPARHRGGSRIPGGPDLQRSAARRHPKRNRATGRSRRHPGRRRRRRLPFPSRGRPRERQLVVRFGAEAMRGQIERTIDIARSLSLGATEGRLQAVQAEHVAVFDAIARRDAPGAPRRRCATTSPEPATAFSAGPDA